MVANDKLIADTLEKKNQLEEYVYDIRGKIEGSHAEFIDPAVKAPFLKKLSETETWLYDEGETATKGAFVERLTALQKESQPVVDRQSEHEARPKAVADLEALIAQIRDAATTNDSKYAHIEPADKAKVIDEANKKEAWLRAQLAAQAALKLYQPPAVRAVQINAERAGLQALTNAILNKPKPQAPAPSATPPPPAPEAKPEASKPEANKPEANGGAANADGSMEVD